MLTASEITRLLDVANAGVQRGEVALARKVYQGILAGRPDHVPTLVSLAMSHIAVGQYGEADGILAKVLEVHPEDPDARLSGPERLPCRTQGRSARHLREGSRRHARQNDGRRAFGRALTVRE